MKSKISCSFIFFILLILANLSNCRSQSLGSHIPNDSLLFDGSNSSFIRPANNKCKIKVISAIGKCVGTYYKDSIGSVCGLKDTIAAIRTGQLHSGDELVPGTEVTTGPNDDVTNETYNIVSLSGVGGDRSTGIMLGSQTFLGKVLLGEDCVFHVKSGNVSVVGPADISTSRSKVTHKNTQYTVEVHQDGDVFTDVIKVYEGSVDVQLNRDDPDYKNISKKRNDALSAEGRKLTEEAQSGKITVDEFNQRFAELQKKLNETLDLLKTVTLTAGNSCSVTEGDVPGDPVPFDVNENHWWEAGK